MNKTRLVKQWAYGNKSYRLVSRARYTPGYDDEYTLEVAGKDAMGGDCWSAIRIWSHDDGNIECEIFSILAAGCD